MSGRNAGRAMTRLGLGILIVLLLAVPTWTVAAETASSTGVVSSGVSAPTPTGAPQQVAVGASVTLSLNSYSPNEGIALWETGPDAAVTSLNGTTADGNGTFTLNLIFPTAGQWSVTAHGKTSGKETVTTYTVGSTTATNAAPGAPPVAPPTNASQVAVGSSVAVAGVGFTANELISLWETGPDSAVTPLSGTMADGNGAFTVSLSFPTAGSWAVTAHGKTSGKELVSNYTVGTTTNTTTTTGTASTTSGTTSGTPPTSGTTPTSSSSPSTGSAPGPSGSGALQVEAGTVVNVGSPVTFSGTGFSAGEPITIWKIAPGNLISALPAIQADGSGAISLSVTFPNDGPWQLIATGQRSGHASIAPYRAVAAS